MASMSAVESEEIFSSCSRNAVATPVLGAIHTCITPPRFQLRFLPSTTGLLSSIKLGYSLQGRACDGVSLRRTSLMDQSALQWRCRRFHRLTAQTHGKVMGDLSSLGELTTYMMPSTTASSTVKKTHFPVLCCWTSKYAASSPTSSSFWQGINHKSSGVVNQHYSLTLATVRCRFAGPKEHT